MLSLLDVLTQSYRLAGVNKNVGQGLSPSAQSEALYIANAFLDTQKVNRCMIPQILRTLVNVTATHPVVQGGWQEYSVGSLEDGADWVVERPERILRASFMVPTSSQPNNPAEIPMEVLLDFTQWQGVVCKAVTSTQARVLYYRASGPPLGTAAVWPVPQADGQLAIYTPGYINEFSDVNDALEVPKGWREFLEYGIAVSVNDRYPGVPMNPRVEARWRELQTELMAAQYTPVFIRCDEGALQGKPDGRRWYDARTWVP